MAPERRGTERKTPAEPSYIQLGEDLGGIVCNVSEAGLAFQLAAPLHSVKTIRTCISPNPSNRIDVTGTLVWTDGTSRFGGLQFTEVGTVAGEQLRNWLAAISRPTIAAEESPFRPQQESVATAWFIGSNQGTLDRSVQTPEQSMAASSQPGTASEFRPVLSSPLPPCSTLSAPWLRSLPVTRTVAIVVACFLLAAAPMVLLHYFRTDVGRSLVRIGEKLQGSRAPGVTRPPALPSGSVGAVNLSAPATRPTAPRESSSVSYTSKPPMEPISARGIMQADERLPSTNPAARQAAPNSRRKRRGVSGQNATAQAFWNAVGRGDVNAEVALAELYMNGDGVSRSCEQARVLLGAAAEKGNGDAARLLEHIRKVGCR